MSLFLVVQAVGTGKNDREYWAQLMPQAVDEHDLMVSLQMLTFFQAFLSTAFSTSLSTFPTNLLEHGLRATHIFLTVLTITGMLCESMSQLRHNFSLQQLNLVFLKFFLP